MGTPRALIGPEGTHEISTVTVVSASAYVACVVSFPFATCDVRRLGGERQHSPLGQGQRGAEQRHRGAAS